ncbi:lipid A biosynthesis acyltransferase [Pseudoflavitalea sp. X16]|uniref:lysophospholipid acyltransferase family protein n=1 Tax=Paraflavitalea devenefica TaxID=2716334 RepID=UPI001420F128|nr:lysophospholipid acyltransferase family protein [Paraflavitalea devenefica]NII24995.1 lipid A biosynthesis acyltransferase [Paraflavitalea devenefica]
MARLSYYIALPFIYLLSLLPFRGLYLLSDGFYLLLYYVIGYRKKVVFTNLRNSFPDKAETELKAIQKRFYRYFCDLFLETFKTLTISPAKMLKHCSMDPAAEALFNGLAAENKSIIIVMGHKGNWEWAGNTFSMRCKHQLYVIYHPLGNPYFNKLIIKMRTRFGTKLIAMKDTFRDMVQNRSHLTATAFIADQTPAPDKAYWMSFLNQDTPVFPGTEKIAQKMNYPIVYVSVQKIKRGYYTLSADLLKMPPYTSLREGEITEAHTKRLEAAIIEQPDTWLWTHRRWKHKRSNN